MTPPSAPEPSRSVRQRLAGMGGVARLVPLRLVLLFALATVITFGIEYLVTRQPNGGAAEALFGLSGLYHQIVTAGPRNQAPRFSALVTISPSVEGDAVTALNVCSQREFLAHVIDAAVASQASVIVLDKFYSPKACPADDVGTRHLIEAIGRALDGGTTVIVARRTAENLPVARTSATAAEPSPGGYVLAPSLEFPPSTRGRVVGQALANFSEDTKRVALGWPVVEESATGGPRFMETIALAAARAHEPEPQLTDFRPRLKRYLERGVQPFVSFIAPEQLQRVTVSASEVVCHDVVDKVAPDVWRKCVEGQASPHPILRSRIVVVGEIAESDYHDTALGSMIGAALHLQYIESVLDERLLTPAGPVVDMLTGFVLYGLLEFFLVRYKHQPAALFLRIAAAIVVAWLIVYALAAQVGVLIQPVLINLVALALKLTSLVYMKFEQKPSAEPV